MEFELTCLKDGFSFVTWNVVPHNSHSQASFFPFFTDNHFSKHARCTYFIEPLHLQTLRPPSASWWPENDLYYFVQSISPEISPELCRDIFGRWTYTESLLTKWFPCLSLWSFKILLTNKNNDWDICTQLWKLRFFANDSLLSQFFISFWFYDQKCQVLNL